MPLSREIAELFEAIPERIEVSGHTPTWRVTGGSFEAALAYAESAYDHPVVLAREDRSRWWRRVTLTVSVDPDLVADAPPLESFADPEPEPEPEPEPDPEPEPEPVVADAAPADAGGLDHFAVLESMFSYQEEVRAAAARVPRQRGRRQDA